MSSHIRTLALAAAFVGSWSAASAKDYEVIVRNDIEYAQHDGVKLVGDLYLPKGVEKAPVLIGVHGGGWQVGDRKFYRNWGTYLAKNGYAVFSIEYRLMKPGLKTYPGAVSIPRRRCNSSGRGRASLASIRSASD
jgi:acetyl esterase/lipase